MKFVLFVKESVVILDIILIIEDYMCVIENKVL